ncbi:MAG TPA: DegT/DnrJ/EryC1/StrS aminotransferase family protein [Nitrospiria bacterium]|nr:DegT/DnrJ/EryC1/StrS aminotransferase family protein [Candidatus Manganitrophaceae bacterium]
MEGISTEKISKSQDIKGRFPEWPSFSDEEIEAVSKVLRSGKVNYWTGKEGRSFEREFAGYCGVDYAVALANGSVALELALYALGISDGDEVIVTSRTFIASASSIVLLGARPIFADVDTVSQNITADSVRKVLTPKTRAIMAVHLAGWPCDMDPILALAREHGLKVIEDCAQSHGATYKGRPVGSFGDAGTFSFCQDKIMTTGGEGGMLLTNSKEVWERAWAYRDHGKSYDTVFLREHPLGFRWLHESFGTNGRMTEMQAAIGRIQLKKLPEWLVRRRSNAAILTKCFQKLQSLRVPKVPEYIEHAYYKYYVFVRPERLVKDWSRDRILEAINSKGVPCFTGSCSEVYREKAFHDSGLVPPKRLENAQELGETSLMFLVHPTLGEEEMARTCNTVKKVMEAASSM